MRKTRKEERETSGTFTTLMTSLSVILLAFFILLNSLATIDNKRVKKALGSLSGTFGILPGGFRPDKGETLLPTWVVDLGIKSSLLSLEELLIRTGKRNDLRIVETEEGLILNMASKLFFPTGSARLQPESIAVLDAVAEIIKANEMPVRIEGHTDNVPVHNKRYASNWELSAARASRVLRYFTEDSGISANLLSAVGYGQYRPLMPNNTKENREKNRRVAIVLLKY